MASARARNSAKAKKSASRDMRKEKSLPVAKPAIENDIHVVDRAGRSYSGAEATFRIAEQNLRPRTWTRLARTPFIRDVAPVCYRLAAADRSTLLAPASRLYWFKVVLVLAFCVGLVMSSHLWIGPRSYPLVPLANALPELDGLLAYGLFAALFILAIFILVAPKPQRFIAAFLAIIAMFCLLDQTRWQPWVFLYSFLLATLALFSGDSTDVGGQRSALNIARVIIACTYLFSGLQKINANFMTSDFPWLIQPITNAFPSTTNLLVRFGMIVPFVQVAFGVALLTKPFRRAALIVAITMHLFILAMFGPTGLDWNNIIWPWTTAMAVFDILLFAGKAEESLSEILWTSWRVRHVAFVVVFAVLPFLSFFNLWDSYLSAALYSGNLTEGEIYITDSGKASLPPSIRQHAVSAAADTNVINLQRWAIEDLNVTPYPETRVYKAIAKMVCGNLRDQRQLVLVVREQRMFFSKPETGYRCWQL